MPPAPPQPPTVRAMQAADLPQALDLWVAAWQAAYPHIDFAARRGWAADRIATLEREGAGSWIAVHQGRVAGLLVVHPGTGYLDQIVVATDLQGRGVAEALLATARRQSPGGLTLHVNQDNARAIRFYEKHGFAIAGTDVNARSGAPIYLMRWAP